VRRAFFFAAIAHPLLFGHPKAGAQGNHARARFSTAICASDRKNATRTGQA
jgi:hypothetical protein